MCCCVCAQVPAFLGATDSPQVGPAGHMGEGHMHTCTWAVCTPTCTWAVCTPTCTRLLDLECTHLMTTSWYITHSYARVVASSITPYFLCDGSQHRDGHAGEACWGGMCGGDMPSQCCDTLCCAVQAALAGAVICLSACVAYCVYSVLFPGLQKRRIDAARRKVSAAPLH
jgi:hypothetical protein